MTQHDFGCRHNGPHCDAARRLSDTYNLHYEAGNLYATTNVGKWIAVTLADGRSDNQIYDSKHDAIWHQNHDEMYYAFVHIVPSSMSVCAAEAYLHMQRLIFDRKMRLNDRDSKSGGYEVIPRLTLEDQNIQNELIRTGTGKIAIGNPA